MHAHGSLYARLSLALLSHLRRLADMLKPALLECWRNGAPHRVEFAA